MNRASRQRQRQRRQVQPQNEGGEQQEEQQQQQQQQQQQPQQNRIRGPTSALSSFLREHGIRVENRSRRRAQREAQQEQETAATSTASRATSETGATETPAETSSASSSTTATPEPSDSTANTTSILYTPGRRRQLNAAATRIIQAAQASSSSSNSTKGKRKKQLSDDSDDDSDTTDNNEAGPSNRPTRRERRNEIVFCDKCKGRFARPLINGNDIETENICPSCLRGESPNKKAKTKATKKQRGNGISQHDKVPSLQDICINIVATHIDDVEAFGEIGLANLDKLAKIICKNRKLTTHTVRLFLEPTIPEVSLYDCTDVDATGLLNIAQFCPNLKKLKLIYCGQMTSEVIQGYASRLKDLRSIELSGPYLVTKEAWIDFIKTVGRQLETFKISHMFRFTCECLETLVEHCPDLKELKFSRLNAMQDDWLPWIEKFDKLTSLELAYPDPKQPKIKAASVIKVLEARGQNLTTLSLSGLTLMDDTVLLDGILDNCPNLQHLNLHDCPNITSEGIQELFTEWNKPSSPSPQGDDDEECDHPAATAERDNNGVTCITKKVRGLERIDISRCLKLEDEALKAILAHSGKTLKGLNLHSVDKLSASGLEMLAGKYPEQDKKGLSATTIYEENQVKACKNLKELNCSYVRSMDDLVLKLLIEECPSLEKIRVWGCNQLTNQITASNVKIIGRELERS
ncbi:hypothetical protein BDA99DRAFT_495096 [Phascolomyces articulosus]|uniref:RNI-like protein n=1 Tax=Phascolomyces articulosus TaxID=60185 RepID=A0AAD5PJE3_9FUNG|nr:hypothetical protein BDA99DRAFT_495096 [Phascolomyces articulosus]